MSEQRFNRDIVQGWLDDMVAALKPQLAANPDIAMIGIRRGGVDIARHLHSALGLTTLLGELNIAFYRDDFSSMGLHPVVGPSEIPFDMDGRELVLVDDVLGTGRTVRAAMNEIFDFGRPARITLAVLVQRDGHELPIRADVVGQRLDVPVHQHIDWQGESMTVVVGDPPAREARA